MDDVRTRRERNGMHVRTVVLGDLALSVWISTTIRRHALILQECEVYIDPSIPSNSTWLGTSGH